MSAPDIVELLERAAPAPTRPLDMDVIHGRSRRRRRRRRGGLAGASLIVGLAIALVAVLPASQRRDTVVAGPPSSRTIEMEVGQRTTTIAIELLDGTRVRVTVPAVAAAPLRGASFGDLVLSAAISADRAAGRGWRIDAAIGSVGSLIPGGERLSGSASGSSEARVDRSERRLGLQFGSWAVIASGDSLTDPEITTLLSGLAFTETAEGLLRYSGTLPLWIADSPAASVRQRDVAVSVRLGTSGGRGCVGRAAGRTANGLGFARRDDLTRPGRLTTFCLLGDEIELDLWTPGPLADGELDQVALDVLSVGTTLSALRRGLHP
ncbi:MAG: hypothetical protein AVDCRST_MAG76-3128 [uncultured Acidimicrobiales bacterium]|uniref:Uncharacterized protein n=1 Tax=uncultured Acidimicrobiales bacterium TaxID=310071 RepID=A0A6J4J082_9ACTN|nr:MAG: hypothetical protein AVDCRST_MAG76-3128 [uncultured Acidimicrobiales bacterium]